MQADIMGRTHKEMIHILATLFVSLTRHSLYQGICGERREGKERQNKRAEPGQSRKKVIKSDRNEPAGQREREYKSVNATLFLQCARRGENRRKLREWLRPSAVRTLERAGLILLDASWYTK